MFVSSWKNKFTLLSQNSVTDVSAGFRPPCWCSSDEHQHGVSVQISINLGKTFLRISMNGVTLKTSNTFAKFQFRFRVENC